MVPIILCLGIWESGDITDGWVDNRLLPLCESIGEFVKE